MLLQAMPLLSDSIQHSEFKPIATGRWAYEDIRETKNISPQWLSFGSKPEVSGSERRRFGLVQLHPTPRHLHPSTPERWPVYGDRITLEILRPSS